MQTNIIKKSRFTGAIISSILLVVFFINLGILLIKTSYPGNLPIWELYPSTILADETVPIFSLALKVLFFFSIIPLLITVYSLIRKNNFGYALSLVTMMAFQILLIVFKLFASKLSPSVFILSIVNLILILIAFSFFIIRMIYLKKENNKEDNNIEENKLILPSSRKMAVGILIINIIHIIALSLIFFLPIYSVSNGSTFTSHYLFEVMLNESTVLLDTIFYLVFLLFYIISLFSFVYSLSYFFSDKINFVSKSTSLIYYNITVSILFFLTSFFTCFFYSNKGMATQTIAFIPAIVLGVLSLFFSIFKGKFELANELKEKNYTEAKHTRFETMLYVTIITAISILALFLNIVVVENTYSSITQSISLSGFDLLNKYSNLGPGYQMVAFYLVILLLVSASCFLWTMTSYLSNYKNFHLVAKVTTYANVGLMLFLGISGFYFSIAQEINVENLKSLLDQFHITYNDQYTYSIRTDAFYALVLDLVVLSIMIIRQSFEKVGEDDLPLVKAELDNASPSTSSALSSAVPALSSTSSSAASSSASTETNSESKEETITNFDPCPAFSELDSKKEVFTKDLEVRNQLLTKDKTLNGLITFIVDYARNSRLHLSYSNSDIATFVAGLGACRLTILQGMSGTGKTSLPKIFSEAINGNCEIIEVESSWKDKNELLGYYNEFSSMYTPKKFTQAVYKAAMNKDIPTFIVLDEMNLSRIEYYFSDFLSLMENEENKRQIKLLNINLYRTENGAKYPYSMLEEGHTLHIPSNIWFIGTANRDESTFVISDKVYDRAHTMNFNKRAPKVRDYKEPLKPCFYTYHIIDEMFKDALKKGTFDAERSNLIKKVEELLLPFNISFGNRILKQIEDFVDIYQACFPTKNVTDEAVETILLSKVVSKLEVKTIDDKDSLVREFEELNLRRCAEFISKLNED